MTTTTLFSNGRMGGYYKNLMKRNLGSMVYFAILGFVVFPLQYFLKVYSVNFDQRLLQDSEYFSQGQQSISLFGHHTEVSIVLFTGIMIIMPLVVGLVQFSYLHSKKAVDVFHSLPMSRDTLLLTNLAAAFTTVMVPAAINYLLVLAAGCTKSLINPLYQFSAGGLLADLACWAVVVLAMLAIIAFVSVQVGSVFDTFIFTAELLVILPSITLLTLGLFEMLLSGFAITRTDFRWVAWLSPVSAMVERYTVDSIATYGWAAPQLVHNTLVMLVWLAVAVLLTVLAIRLYRTRRSEIAETSTSSGVLAQVGKFAAVYVVGPFLGLIFSSLMSDYTVSRVKFVLWTLVFSALAYVLIEVILQRGFRGIKKSILPGCLSVGLVTIFVMVLSTGGLGYESRLPVLSNIDTVTIDYRGRYNELALLKADTAYAYIDTQIYGRPERYNYERNTDVTLSTPEAIGAVAAMHKAIVDENSRSVDYNRNISIELVYNLKNGKRMTRHYDASQIGESGIAALLALENNVEFKEKTHPLFVTEAADYSSVTIVDGFGLQNSGEVTDAAFRAQLMEALRADLLAEDMTRLDGQGDRAVATIHFELAQDPTFALLTEDTYDSCMVAVFDSYTKTLELLRSNGYSDLVSGDTAAVTKVVVYPSNWARFYTTSVISQSNYFATGTEFSEAYYEDNDVYTTTDPATIRQLTMLSFTQRMWRQQTDMVTMVFFDANDTAGSGVLLLPSELPQEVLDALPEYYTSSTVETVVAELA